jgi:predicted lactoylglutathione lyase
MELGAFSISLTVQDLQASRDFYEKLGFDATGGSEEQDYLIMRNDVAARRSRTTSSCAMMWAY